MKRLILTAIISTILIPMTLASTKSAVFGGGCFWCVEALYEDVPGIISVESGFAGGTTPNPTYEEVCSGATGHAEVVKITYDPDVISYEKVLDLFWKAHDPTTLNRQGADVGTQYRSIILYGDESEKKIAEESKTKAQADFDNPIVTEIVPLTAFYPAEKYHQDFYRNNPSNPYVCAVIAPKVKKFRKELEKE